MSITREIWMKYDVGDSRLSRRTSESISTDLISLKGSIIEFYALLNIYSCIYSFALLSFQRCRSLITPILLVLSTNKQSRTLSRKFRFLKEEITKQDPSHYRIFSLKPHASSSPQYTFEKRKPRPCVSTPPKG